MPHEREGEAGSESNSVFHAAVETARKLIEEAERSTPRTHVTGSAPRRLLSVSLAIPGRPATDQPGETNEAPPVQGDATAPRASSPKTATPVRLWAWKGSVLLPDGVVSSIEIVGDGIETRLHGKGELSPAAPAAIPPAIPPAPSAPTPSAPTPSAPVPSPSRIETVAQGIEIRLDGKGELSAPAIPPAPSTPAPSAPAPSAPAPSAPVPSPSRIETVAQGIEIRLDGKGELPAPAIPPAPSAPARLAHLEKTISDSDQALSPASAAHQEPRALPVENSVPVAASVVESPTISPPVEPQKQASTPAPPSHTPRARDVSKREPPQSPGVPPRREIDSKQLTLSPATAPDLDTVAGTKIAASRDPDILHSTVEQKNFHYALKEGYKEPLRAIPAPKINPEHTPASRSSQPGGRHAGGQEGRPQPEPASSAPILSERAATISRKTENALLTAARLEIRPAGQPVAAEPASTERAGAADKFSTAYPQRAVRNDSLVKQQPTTPQPTLGTYGTPPNSPTGAPSIGHLFAPVQRGNSSLRESATTAESKGQAPKEQTPGARQRDALLAQVYRSRAGVTGKPTSSDFVEPPRPDRLPATAFQASPPGSTSSSLETRTGGGETTALSQPAPKPGQDPPPMPRAASSPASANEGAETIERFVEMASLRRQSASGQMNIHLRDSRLGRISLRLVERAGLIEAIVRSDNPRTGSLINDTLPRLFESLAGRGLQAQAAAHSNGSAGYGDPHHQQQGGRRQQRSFRPKQHTGRQVRSFQLEVERGG